MLTIYECDEAVRRALQAGAAMYLPKDTLAADLLRTIREAYTGAKPTPPNVVTALADRAVHRRLTPRELGVLEEMAGGLRNKEIAGVLHIAEETVRVHVKNILAKLGVSDRTTAVIEGLRRGLIRLPLTPRTP